MILPPSIALKAGGAVLAGTGLLALAYVTKTREDARDAKRAKAGEAGEAKVARALARAGIPALTDITLRDPLATFWATRQIDHVAAAGNALYVLETKTWHGHLRLRLGGFCTVRRRDGSSFTTVNPTIQNAPHADLIGRVTLCKTVPIVVLAGHVTMDRPLPDFATIPDTVNQLKAAGYPTRYAMMALDHLRSLQSRPDQARRRAAHIARARARKSTGPKLYAGALLMLATGAALLILPSLAPSLSFLGIAHASHW